MKPLNFSHVFYRIYVLARLLSRDIFIPLLFSKLCIGVHRNYGGIHHFQDWCCQSVYKISRSDFLRPFKVRQVKSKVKSMLITFLWHQRDCSQRICLGRPNSQFCKLLWHFTLTAWKCVKTSRLWQQKNWLLCHDNTPCHILGIVDKKQHDCHPPPNLLFPDSPV
jgi:hypothetical protein